MTKVMVCDDCGSTAFKAVRSEHRWECARCGRYWRGQLKRLKGQAPAAATDPAVAAADDPAGGRSGRKGRRLRRLIP